AWFFLALQQVLAENRGLRDKVQVDIYGSFDGGSEQEMRRLQLEDLVVCHGLVPRQQAIEAIQKTDCLLLIQNIIYFSCETIPSKVYEYLLSERPIIGLLHNNKELEAMLQENGHWAVPATDMQAVITAIRGTLDDFAREGDGVVIKSTVREWTVAQAVNELIRLAEVKK
ncbi:MAG: glycosyltransferase, partial [Candidatus Electrothrix sp. AR3]|nr:glycosyltransferase [Candidatus Electrothrix sp. AR3]